MILESVFFGAILHFSGMAILHKYDGIFGLDFHGEHNMGKVKTMLDLMHSRQSITEHTFSLLVYRNRGGLILFGSPIPQMYTPPLISVPLVEKNTWHVHVDGISIAGSIQFCKKGCRAHVDPGNNHIAMRFREQRQLNTQILDAKESIIDGFHYVSCSKSASLPEITFNINGQQFSIPPTIYILQKVCECINANCLSKCYIFLMRRLYFSI